MEVNPPARIPANEVARAQARAVIAHSTGGEAGSGKQCSGSHP